MQSHEATTNDSLDTLYELATRAGRSLTFMEVCGTHTTAAFRTGLHSLMPANVRLISGPGCPVCVTAQGDIDLMIELAGSNEVTLCTYGDMLRVPGRHGSLERARSQGANVHIVYSALDAVALAQNRPEEQVVFAAVGFETTAPASAVAVIKAAEAGLANFTVLTSHKRVIPAMTALLESHETDLDGFMCPGHVSVVIGAQAYGPIAEGYGIPCVVSGFEGRQMLDAVIDLTRMAIDEEARLVNRYNVAVKDTGNPHAIELIDRVFEPNDMRWRGLGIIPDSGLHLKPEWSNFDAHARFGLTPVADREPKSCICGKVIAGIAGPHECELFGSQCTPQRPIGPCMVSSEGTCAAWFKYRPKDRSQRHPGVAASSPVEVPA